MNYRQLFSTADDETQTFFELERLQILENAVLNYGGGLFNLQKRAEKQVPLLMSDCPEAAAVLGDLAHYLRDVAKAGRLKPDRLP